jgi:hypothetical protein
MLASHLDEKNSSCKGCAASGAGGRLWRRKSLSLQYCAGQKGNALVIALLVLLLLSSLAVTFVSVTKTEKQISGNSLRATQALYAAEAGLSECLARMSVPSSAAYIGEPSGTPPTPGWGRYIVLSTGASTRDPERSETETDGLDNDGDGTIDESGEAYPEVFSAQVGLTDPVNYPWVKVTYKEEVVGGARKVVLYGDHDNNPATRPVENLVAGVPVIQVTSNGLRNTSSKTIEVEAVKLPGPSVPGSVYTEGILICKGAAFHIDGNDYDPATGEIVPGSIPLPGVVPTGGVEAVDCTTPHGWNNIVGAGAVPSIVPPAFDINLPALLGSYAENADVVLYGTQMNPGTDTWGSLDHFVVVYIKEGDLHLSGDNSGGGMLLVDGDVMISGRFTWYGLILTLGDVDLVGGGTGIHIYGAIMTQGDISSSGNVSGNSDVFYSSEMISKLTEFTPYKVIMWEEK